MASASSLPSVSGLARLLRAIGKVGQKPNSRYQGMDMAGKCKVQRCDLQYLFFFCKHYLACSMCYPIWINQQSSESWRSMTNMLALAINSKLTERLYGTAAGLEGTQVYKGDCNDTRN